MSYLKWDPAKLQAEYNAKVEAKIAENATQMCWPIDWLPEDLNLENGEETSIWAMAAGLTELTMVGGQNPVVGAPVQAQDVLVFMDGYGFAKEILDCVPTGRLGIVNKQTKPAGKYTAKEVTTLCTMHPWDIIIFAMGVDLPPNNSVEAIHQLQNDVTKLYLWILQAIAREPKCCKGLAVLTADVFAEEKEIHEELGLGITTNAVLFGMSNTARQEIECPLQYIDTEWAFASENIPKIMTEIFRKSTFGHNLVRILNRGRFVCRQQTSKKYEMANKGELLVPKDGVILITGGNGALGLVMGTWLMDKAKFEASSGPYTLKVKFLSRSTKVSDQNQPMWDKIQNQASQLGITVSQDKCDCSAPEAVDELIAAESPNIRGIIHSGGVLQDSMLFNQTWEKFETVFSSKSRAAVFIHDALERNENPNLDFYWVFSSGAVFGNMGQLNYSGSNSYLDSLMRHRRALGKPGMAPQWGAWGEVGMAANLDDASRRRMANSPMPYFSVAEGLKGLEQGIRSGLPVFQVHKFNGAIMMGSVAGTDGSASSHHYRNFHSEVCAIPFFYDPNQPYEMLRQHVSEGQSISQGLVFKHYYPKVAEMIDAEL